MSSINLDDSYKILKTKILNCKKEDEEVILQMITLVSDWSLRDINNAVKSFDIGGKVWMDCKKNYLDYFYSIKKKWQATSNYKNKSYFNFDNLFIQK